MITSLQNFFLKHNKWLFSGLLVVVIVTFVLTIGPQSFFGSRAKMSSRKLNYYGYNLSSEADQRAMLASAEISAILHPELGVRRDQLMDYAYLRVAALGMAEKLGIPAPTKEELKDFVSTLMIFADPATGEFSADSYKRILDAMQANSRYDRDSIGRVMREDYRIDQVRRALGGPDYTLPYETQQDYLSGKTSYTVDLAHLDYASFDPAIEVSEENLLQFFNENPSRYKIPETISTMAILFKADAYMGEVAEPTEEDLQAAFATNKSRYEAAREKPKEGEPALPELTLDDVRDKVVADWKKQQATKIAAKKGEQFSLRLWQNSIALDSPEFTSLVAEFEAQTRDLPPYARSQPPRMADVPVQVLNSVWVYANNPNRYFSDIAQISDGAVILVRKGLTEARMPTLEEVRDQVVADYKLSEKRRLFSEKGTEIHEELKTKLAGESFDEAAKSLGLTVEDLDPFTGTDIPKQLQVSTIWDQTRYLDKGEITPMVIEGDTGTFAYMADKDVPELDVNSEDFKSYLAQRSSSLNDVMGWARLREIADASVAAVLGAEPDNQ